MRKRILSFITLLLLVITTTVPTYANNQKNGSDIYYTTQHGVELTQIQYENLTKVYTPEELDCLPIPFIERNKNDDQLRLADSDEAYVVTQTFYDDNNQPINTINKEVSETEAMMLANLPKTSLSNSMAITLLVGALPFTVYGTYQHATSDLTLSQSQNYTFSSSGLGGVLKFANSVSSKYDGMKGVSATCALP